jgi:hypothetical protein
MPANSLRPLPARLLPSGDSNRDENKNEEDDDGEDVGNGIYPVNLVWLCP